MLDNLRKKQKIVIYFIAFVFIIGMAGLGISDFFNRPPSYIGKVNGTKITIEMYQNKIAQLERNYREMYQDRELDENTRRTLEEQAWTALVEEILLEQQLKKNRIKITDDDIIAEMQNNPPQELMQNEVFQTNGRFDRSKYLNALKMDPTFFTRMEEYIRSYLPKQRLQEQIQQQSGITIDSLKAEYIKESDELYGRAIWFNYNSLPEITVSDEEIRNHYETVKDQEYKKGPAARMKFITFKFEPTDDDFNAALQTANEVYSLAVRGDDFAAIAEMYSDDPGSAQNGGSLGVFGKGQMVPEFEQTAFKMKPGEISQPFRTQFGWHVIKLIEIADASPENYQVNASHVLIKVSASEETKREIFQQAQDSRKLIRRTTIDSVAVTLKLEVKDSDWVQDKDDYIPMLGKHYALMHFLRNGKVNQVSEVMFDNQGNAIVAQITDRQNVYYEDYEKIKLRIKYELERKKKIAAMKPKAEDFFKQHTAATFFKAAEAAGHSIIDLQRFRSDSQVPNVGKSTDFTTAALALKTGETSGLIHTPEGTFIIYCEKRNSPDIDAFMKDNEYQEKIRKRMEEQAWNRWWDDMRKGAVIIDNRHKLRYR